MEDEYDPPVLDRVIRPPSMPREPQRVAPAPPPVNPTAGSKADRLGTTAEWANLYEQGLLTLIWLYQACGAETEAYERLSAALASWLRDGIPPELHRMVDSHNEYQFSVHGNAASLTHSPWVRFCNRELLLETALAAAYLDPAMPPRSRIFRRGHVPHENGVYLNLAECKLCRTTFVGPEMRRWLAARIWSRRFTRVRLKSGDGRALVAAAVGAEDSTECAQVVQDVEALITGIGAERMDHDLKIVGWWSQVSDPCPSCGGADWHWWQRQVADDPLRLI